MPTRRRLPTITDPPRPDYDAPDTLVVSEPAQLHALADERRLLIVARLRERARSTQQLADELGIPKGTVGHHLKVLEKAGLVHIVRTRQVRAVTEKFYGRTARLFLFQVDDAESERALGATVLRQAATEVAQASSISFGHPHARLRRADAGRIERRVARLLDAFMAADTPDGEPYALVTAVYRRPDA